MLEKNISIEGQGNTAVNEVKDSTIKIANNQNIISVEGDLRIGMSYTEVKDLCQALIALEVGRLTKEAEEDFRKRLEAFERKFYERLNTIEEKENIERLKKPGIQLCLHSTIISSMKTDDEPTKEQLQEMLIDRLKVDENMTDRAIIEDAIERATKISKPLMALMVALQLRSYFMAGSYKFALDSFFSQMGAFLDALEELTLLDIAYGVQLQCLMNLPATTKALPVEDILLNNYDLYFRHSITLKEYNSFRVIHPEIQHAVRLNSIDGLSMIGVDVSKRDVSEEDSAVFIMAASSRYLKSQLMEQGKQYMIPVLDELLKKMPLFSKEEVMEYLIRLHVGWAKFFRIFDKYNVNDMELTPVGNYLALVYTRSLTHLSAEFLKQMYGTQ